MGGVQTGCTLYIFIALGHSLFAIADINLFGMSSLKSSNAIVSFVLFSFLGFVLLINSIN